MPETGAGSMGRFGRRLVGLLIDWFACTLIAAGLFGAPVPFFSAGGTGGGPATVSPLLVFAIENVVLVATVGTTLGHRLVGLRVGSVTRPMMTPVQVLVRTLLLCLFIPAVIWDSDGRGLHDRLAGTAIVRT